MRSQQPHCGKRMTNFDRRLARLEHRMSPTGPPRIVVRFVNGGDLLSTQPDEDIENARVIVVRFVEAREGRPEPQRCDSRGGREAQIASECVR